MINSEKTYISSEIMNLDMMTYFEGHNAEEPILEIELSSCESSPVYCYMQLRKKNGRLIKYKYENGEFGSEEITLELEADIMAALSEEYPKNAISELVGLDGWTTILKIHRRNKEPEYYDWWACCPPKEWAPLGDVFTFLTGIECQYAGSEVD